MVLYVCLYFGFCCLSKRFHDANTFTCFTLVLCCVNSSTKFLLCKASRMFNLGFILCELWYKCIYFGSHILDLFVHFQMVQIELQYAVTSSWQVGKNAWDEYTLPSQFSYILNCWNILRTNICPYIVHVTSFHCLNLVIWDYFERNNLKQLLVFNLFVFFVRFWFRLVYCCYWNQRLGLNY